MNIQWYSYLETFPDYWNDLKSSNLFVSQPNMSCTRIPVWVIKFNVFFRRSNLDYLICFSAPFSTLIESSYLGIPQTLLKHQVAKLVCILPRRLIGFSIVRYTCLMVVIPWQPAVTHGRQRYGKLENSSIKN